MIERIRENGAGFFPAPQGLQGSEEISDFNII
jgi:hypothetical protein